MSCLPFFFFNDMCTSEIYTGCNTLSIHDALPFSCIAAAAAHEALPADDDGGSVREGGADDVPCVTFECEPTNRTEPSTNPRTREIGRAHVRTPVTNAHLVCRLLREKTNMIKK